MKQQGLKFKDGIEGTPRRQVPILLRQTSFLALEECTRFRVGVATVVHDNIGENTKIQGMHEARFGEIEQRGAAVTHKGRALYDAVLAEGDGSDWSSLPDNWDALVNRELVHYLYCVKRISINRASHNIDKTRPISVQQLLKDDIL